MPLAAEKNYSRNGKFDLCGAPKIIGRSEISSRTVSKITCKPHTEPAYLDFVACPHVVVRAIPLPLSRRQFTRSWPEQPFLQFFHRHKPQARPDKHPAVIACVMTNLPSELKVTLLMASEFLLNAVCIECLIRNYFAASSACKASALLFARLTSA